MRFFLAGKGDVSALETMAFEATQVADIFQGTPNIFVYDQS